MKFNILTLHAIPDLRLARNTNLDYLYFLERQFPEHNYLYCNIREPATAALRSMEFHAVIFHTTALNCRYIRPRALFESIQEDYAFIADCEAIKIAFPQDDYDHCEILEDWLRRLKVDVVFSVLYEHRFDFFPRLALEARFEPALTGYVNDFDLTRYAQYSRPLPQREIDIGYRARFLPAQFGFYGQIKALIAEYVSETAIGTGVTVDISTSENDVIVGTDWLKFIGNCRWNIGSEGGSSIRDPRGLITDSVREYVRDHPEATFGEISENCLPPLQEQKVYSAVSPRLFEAAGLGCAQLLVPGSYLGRLVEYEHYLPLAADGSNAKQIIEETKNLEVAQRMASACYEALILPEDFRYSTHAGNTLGIIAGHAETRKLGVADDRQFQRWKSRHQAQSQANEKPQRPLRMPHRSLQTRLSVLGVAVLERVPKSIRRIVPPPLKRRILDLFGY